MTENTEALLGIMEIMDLLEELAATNELIAQGLVTDPTVVRETAEASAVFLRGLHQQSSELLDGSDESKVIFQSVTDLIVND